MRDFAEERCSSHPPTVFLEMLEDRRLLAAETQVFAQTNLVGSQPGSAFFTDTNLVNPWGVTALGAAVWVAHRGSGTAAAYDARGRFASPLVTIPAGPDNATDVSSPTGIAVNKSGGFVLRDGQGRKLPASLLFASADGTISAYHPRVDLRNAILKIDNSDDGSFYTGLAIGDFRGKAYAYAADFADGRIEAFDQSFRAATLPFSFSDSRIPDDFVPFNVQNLFGRLFVTYVQIDSSGNLLSGPGSGFVNVFSTSGKLIRRLVVESALDAPWGMAVAPQGFGAFSGRLLVANGGDGVINAFDTRTGAFRGTLANTSRNDLVLENPHGLAFSGGRLFFAAAPNGGFDGLFGTLRPLGSPFAASATGGSGFFAGFNSGGTQVSVSLFDGGNTASNSSLTASGGFNNGSFAVS